MEMPLVELAYGRQPKTVSLAAGSRVLLRPPAKPCPVLGDVIEDALDNPIGAPALETLTDVRRALVIVSDSTRSEPRAEMLDAIRDRLPQAELTIAIANGTHVPSNLDALALPGWASSPLNHDSRDPSNIVDFGTTLRGTPLRLNRIVGDVDLIVATGSIRPHYFAGFGGGVKTLFPGLGENEAIRQNHQLKSHSDAVAGKLEGNPCRNDLEEVIAAVGTQTFLLNLVVDSFGSVQSAVAGGLIEAHRIGAERCRPFFSLTAARSNRIVVSDGLPVAATLYQACKMIAACAPLCEAPMTLILAAECADGIGGRPSLINDKIFELGMRHRLPNNTRIVLVSPTLVPHDHELFCDVVGDFEGLLDAPVLAIPSAGASLLLSAG